MLHPSIRLPTTAQHAHISSYSSTVYPSSHRHPFAWPSSTQLVYTQATPSQRPSAFQRDTNPDLPVHRGETRLRQAARGSPAPFLVVSVLLALLLAAALCKPFALRLWLEPAVETRTHLRSTIHARRQTPHTTHHTTPHDCDTGCACPSFDTTHWPPWICSLHTNTPFRRHCTLACLLLLRRVDAGSLEN